MWHFWIGGGFSMWFVALFGLVTLVNGAWFAFRPSERRLGLVRPMSVATVFATIGGLCANFAAVFRYIATAEQEWNRRLVAGFYGCNEALAPGILGFILLSLAWLLVAIGLRRQS